jgi:hypothetical protein
VSRETPVTLRTASCGYSVVISNSGKILLTCLYDHILQKLYRRPACDISDRYNEWRSAVHTTDVCSRVMIVSPTTGSRKPKTNRSPGRVYNRSSRSKCAWGNERSYFVSRSNSLTTPSAISSYNCTTLSLTTSGDKFFRNVDSNPLTTQNTTILTSIAVKMPVPHINPLCSSSARANNSPHCSAVQYTS